MVLSLICFQISFAQCDQRYLHRYFDSIQIYRDVVYSKNAPALIAATLTTETTINKDLVMDVFMPPSTDTVLKRPAVVIGHGGGFINVAFMGGTLLVGTMDNDDVQALADTLAHWGYVTAVIEYRLGFNVSSSTSIKRAVWRGTQDMSAAIRFLRLNANWFGIEPELVFSSGSSAGAFCAIHEAFVDESERMPESFELLPIFMKDLGSLHSRPVVQLNSFDPFSGNNVSGNAVDSIPRAVAAYWGAIADLNWIDQGGNHAPIILFHGDSDPVVYYKCARPFASVILTAPVTCGSYSIDSVMNAEGILSEVYYGNGEGHEYWGALNGNWINGNPNAYFNDIISKTSHFFYELAKPGPPNLNGPLIADVQNTYTYTIQSPDPLMNYCWAIDGGVLVSSDPNASSIDVQFNAVSTAKISVSAINEHDFVSDKDSILVNVTPTASIPLEKLPINFEISPNPSDRNVWIQFSDNIKSGQLILMNISGMLINEWKLKSPTKRMQLKELEPGIYWVIFQGEKHQIHKKIVIY